MTCQLANNYDDIYRDFHKKWATNSTSSTVLDGNTEVFVDINDCLSDTIN